MGERVVPTRREQLTVGRRSAERWLVPAGLAVTLLALLIVFYLPVGSVLGRALFSDGQLTGDAVLAVLGDPFYTGAAAELVTDPIGVPAGILGWIASIGIGDRGLFVPSVRLGLIGFTAYQALLSSIASVALGLPGAYLLARYEFPGRATVRSLTVLPFVLPSILVAVGFLAMFGRTGTLNDLLGMVGFGPVNLVFTLEIIVLAHAFYNAPLVTRLVSAAWEGLDVDRVESARALGATRWDAFRDVVWPTIRPALFTAALLAFIFSFMTFPIVLALGGLRLATLEVWLYAAVQDLRLTEAATLATLETAVTLGLMYLYLRYEERQSSIDGTGRVPTRRPLVSGLDTLTDPRRLGLIGYGAVVGVVFIGPLLSLLLESVTGPGGGFTTAHYAFLLEQQTTAVSGTVRPLPAIRNSIAFGLGTLLIAVPMGTVVSLVAVRGGVGSRAAEALLSAPLAVSGVVVGLGLLDVLVFGTMVAGHRLTATGPAVIVLAHAVAAYPFVTRTVTPALARIDSQLREVARSLGATWVRALIDIELPLIAAPLLAGAAFAFAISLGEFDSTVLLAEGVESATMPVALERYIGNRSIGPSLGPATAMGTVLLAVTAISFVAIDRLGGRWSP